MENRSPLLTVLIPAVAGLAGVAAGSLLNYNAQKHSAEIELIRFAANGPVEQSVKNLKFWTRLGLLDIGKTNKEIEEATRDCLGLDTTAC